MNFRIAAALSVVLIGLAACRITEDNPTSSGTFVDAPVQGLYYAASPSGLSGVTDVAGNYKYKTGDTMTFVLGGGGGANGATLGIAKPDANGRVTPYSLSPANGAVAHPDFAVNNAQMLQTLGGADPSKPIVLPADNDPRLNSIKNVNFNTDNASYQTSANNNGAPQTVTKQQAQSNLDQGTDIRRLDFLGTTWTDTFAASNCPGGTSTMSVTFNANGISFSNKQSCAGINDTSASYDVACLPSNCTTENLSGTTGNGTRYQLKLSNRNAANNSNGKLVPEGTLTLTHSDGFVDTLTRSANSGGGGSTGMPAPSAKLEFLGTAWTDTFAASGCPGGASTLTVTFTATGTAYSNQQTCAGSNAPTGSNSYEPPCMPSNCAASDLSGQVYNGTRYELTLSNSGGALNSNGKLVPAGTLKLTHSNNSVDTLTR